MAVKFSNNAKTTLTANVSATATTLAVTDASEFPTLTGSDHTYATLETINYEREVVKVTAISGNNLTVVRGQDNTTARTFVLGDKCELRLNAAMLDDATFSGDFDDLANKPVVGDSGLTQKNFTLTLKNKLDGIEAGANNFSLPFTDNSNNWNTAYGWGNHATQSYATTSDVTTAITNLIDSSPATLNTLNELASALGDDANFSTTITSSIATKLPLAGGTLTGNINFGFNKAIFGSSAGGLELSHSGFNGSIECNSGSLSIVNKNGSGILFLQPDASQVGIKIEKDSAVELGFSGSTKCKTTSTGIDITGNVSLEDNGKATFGASDDLEIFHDGSNSYIKDTGTGNLRIDATNFYVRNSAGSELKIGALDDGSVDLYHNGAKKLATTATGVDVTGSISFGDAHTIGNDGFDNLAITSSTSENIVLKPSNATYIEHAGSTKLVTTSTGIDITGDVTLSGNIFTDQGFYGDRIWNEDNSDLRFATNNAEKMRVTSAGNFLVGTTNLSWLSNPGHIVYGNGASAATVSNSIVCSLNRLSTEGPLLNFRKDGTSIASIGVKDARPYLAGSSAGIRVASASLLPTNSAGTTTNNTMDIGLPNEQFKDIYIGGVSYAGQVNAYGNLTLSADFNANDATSNSNIIFKTDTTEKARIDSFGNVGIGTTSPAELLHVHENTTAVARMRLSNTEGYLEIGTNNQVMHLDSQTHTFRNEAGSTEYMRISTSGDVLVGTTSTSIASSGIRFFSGGNAAITSAGTPLEINRLSTDGNIIDLKKDGTTVGTISTKGDDLTIQSSATNHKGLRFGDSYIAPTDNGANIQDATTNLGTSSNRFKDLYLSGGVHLGGTGSANKLDHYAEGSWTPSLSVQSGTFTISSRSGKYTRIGNLMFISGKIQLSYDNSSGTVKITGLPTSIASGAVGIVSFHYAAMSGLYAGLTGYITTNEINVREQNSSGTENPNLTSSTLLEFSGHYQI